jgi:hypothetical protein
MSGPDLNLAIAFLRRSKCEKCNGKQMCVKCWRDWNDTAQIIAHTTDKKRAKA